MTGTIKDKIAAVGKAMFERVIDHIGCDPDPAERHTASILRERFLH